MAKLLLGHIQVLVSRDISQHTLDHTFFTALRFPGRQESLQIYRHIGMLRPKDFKGDPNGLHLKCPAYSYLP